MGDGQSFVQGSRSVWAFGCPLRNQYEMRASADSKMKMRLILQAASPPSWLKRRLVRRCWDWQVRCAQSKQLVYLVVGAWLEFFNSTKFNFGLTLLCNALVCNLLLTLKHRRKLTRVDRFSIIVLVRKPFYAKSLLVLRPGASTQSTYPQPTP